MITKLKMLNYLLHLALIMTVTLKACISEKSKYSSSISVRLNNTRSSNRREGRLEVNYNGTWGTVCDYRFTALSVRVACASLGYGNIGAFIGNRHGGGTGPIWLDKVRCLGNENGIDKCNHNTWGSHNCSHNNDVSISCSNIGCEKNIYSDRMGVIYSPGFPNDERSSVNCIYSIKRAGADSVTILFPVFDLKYYFCSQGYLVEVKCANKWHNQKIQKSTDNCDTVGPRALQFKSCDHVKISLHKEYDEWRYGYNYDYVELFYGFQLVYGFQPDVAEDTIFSYSGLPFRNDTGQNVTCPGSSRSCNSSRLSCENGGLCCEIHNTSDKYCMCQVGYTGYKCERRSRATYFEVIEKPSLAPWILLGVFAVLVGLSFLIVISVMVYKSCKSKQDSSDEPQTIQLRNISPGAHHDESNEAERASGGYEHIQHSSSSQTHDNYYESISE